MRRAAAPAVEPGGARAPRRGRPALAVPPRRRLGQRADAPARRRRSSGCCTATARPVHVAVDPARARPRDLRRRAPARSPTRCGGSGGCASRTGVDDDLRPFHDAFRDDPVIGRAVRALPARCASRRAAAAVGGARRRDHRAADRVRARGRDPAPADRARSAARCPRPACATPRRPPPSPALAPARLAAFDLAPTRALTLRRAAAEVARRPRRPARRRPDARLAPAARDPRRRPVDARDARAPRPGPLRPRPGRRPRLPQARRPAHDRQPAGARRRGRGARVLRALRRVEGPRRRVPASPRAPRPAAASVLLERVARVEPLAGRNSFVSDLLGVLPPLDQPVVEHPVARSAATRRVLEAERPLRVVGEEDRQRRLDRPPPAAPRSRPGSAASSAVDARLRVVAQRVVPARGAPA